MQVLEPICKDCRYFKAGIFSIEPFCTHPVCRDVVTGGAVWCKTARLIKCERGCLYEEANNEHAVSANQAHS